MFLIVVDVGDGNLPPYVALQATTQRSVAALLNTSARNAGGAGVTGKHDRAEDATRLLSVPDIACTD